MADGLIEVFHELEGFRCRATDHYPKSKVYFQREYHRVSPLFDLRGLEAPNAPHGTTVPTGDWGQFKVVRCIITFGCIFQSQRPRIEHAEAETWMA
jgi:hypothetical protein